MTLTSKTTTYTTGQVSKLLQVAPRTVAKWFDCGWLQGYRLPGSKDRRIPKDALITFCKQFGVPVPEGLKIAETH